MVNTSNQSYRILHSFNGSDGGEPWGTLALSDGVLYGTACQGGFSGAGTVFRLNANGSGFALLRSCSNINSDASPHGGVVVSGSVLYGATYGTVFKMNTDGTGYSVLHQFSGDQGYGTWCTLLMSDSTLFGSVRDGGTNGYGTIFKVNVDGSGFTVLKRFAGGDGAFPVSGFVMSGTTFYGGTTSGGSWGYGLCLASIPMATDSGWSKTSQAATVLGRAGTSCCRARFCMGPVIMVAPQSRAWERYTRLIRMAGF